MPKKKSSRLDSKLRYYWMVALGFVLLAIVARTVFQLFFPTNDVYFVGFIVVAGFIAILFLDIKLLNFIKNLMGASPKDVDAYYTKQHQSPVMYILLFLLGLGVLYLSFFRYTSELPPKGLLIFMGIVLTAGSIVGWLRRNIPLKKGRKVSPKQFEYAKRATVFGLIWLIASTALFKYLSLSFWQGLGVAAFGILVAYAYYIISKNR